MDTLSAKGNRMRLFSRAFLFGAALAVALSVTSSTSRLAARGAQQEDNGIAPSAMAQIQALLEEKETRTPAERKIDSQLLYARRMELGVPIAPGVQTLEVDVPRGDDGHVIVDVKANVTGRLMLQLNGLSREIKRTGDTDLRLHVDLDQIEMIAEQPDVLFVQPQQRAFTSRRIRRPGGVWRTAPRGAPPRWRPPPDARARPRTGRRRIRHAGVDPRRWRISSAPASAP